MKKNIINAILLALATAASAGSVYGMQKQHKGTMLDRQKKLLSFLNASDPQKINLISYDPSIIQLIQSLKTTYEHCLKIEEAVELTMWIDKYTKKQRPHDLISKFYLSTNEQREKMMRKNKFLEAILRKIYETVGTNDLSLNTQLGEIIFWLNNRK